MNFMNRIKLIFFVLFLTAFGSVFTEELDQSYLTIESIQNSGLVLELNDGSMWDIQYFGGLWRLLGWGWIEQNEVSHWNVGDKIEILYPGDGNFYDFLLLIANITKKEEIYATLKQAPSVNYSACLWIAEFDKNKNLVTLNDGSKWIRTNSDMYGVFFNNKNSSLNLWETGDPITLIKAEGWLNKNTFLLWNHVTHEMPVVSPKYGGRPMLYRS